MLLLGAWSLEYSPTSPLLFVAVYKHCPQELICCSYRACYGVLRFVMESGAKGCEVRHDVVLILKKRKRFLLF